MVCKHFLFFLDFDAKQADNAVDASDGGAVEDDFGIFFVIRNEAVVVGLTVCLEDATDEDFAIGVENVHVAEADDALDFGAGDDVAGVDVGLHGVAADKQRELVGRKLLNEGFLLAEVAVFASIPFAKVAVGCSKRHTGTGFCVHIIFGKRVAGNVGIISSQWRLGHNVSDGVADAVNH